uniref:Uncharacterized protein n=1 Tax=Romanomermis culicivorax TaxID=13658 RepID=A0A915JKQ2_ROMCU
MKRIIELLRLKDEMDEHSSLSHLVVQKKMDNADPRSGKIDVAIVQMTAVDDQPFSVVVNPVSASVNQNIPSFLVNHPILHLDSTFVEGFSCNDTKNDVEPEEFKISKDMRITQGFQKRLEILDDVSVVCNYAGQTVMICDLISDVYHGNKLSALKDVGFLATTALSPRLGPLFTRIGISQVAKEAKISGYAMKALGFGISRAISLYVLSDFIYNTVKYVQNTNDTGAEQVMIVDGAFLAIDVLVLGIEAFEAAGYFAGVAAIARPVAIKPDFNVLAKDAIDDKLDGKMDLL